MSKKAKIAIAILGAFLIVGAIVGFAVTEPVAAKAAAKYVLHLLNSVPAEVYDVIGTAIVGAIIASPVGSGLIKWFQVESEKYKIAIVGVLSFAVSLGGYLATDPTFSPWVIAIEGFATLGMTQPLYLIFLKPTFIKLSKAVSAKIAQMAVDIEQKAAKVPAGGQLPSPTPSYSTFGE